MDYNIEKEMSALLYNFWIIKDKDRDLYYQIKSNQNKVRDFISKNLGSNLIIHDKFIKLEKIPFIIKKNSGIENFNSVLEYVILSIMLIFLEDKTHGDYFILSDLIEYVKNTAVTLELNHIPDWNKTQDRRAMLNVINLLNELSILNVRDEGKVSFVEDKQAEALYEAMGISNYFMRMFDEDINNLETPTDFIKSEFSTQNEDKGDIRRYKIFRNILYTPAVSTKDLSPTEIDYIKKNRKYISKEITDKLNMEVEITDNLTILYDDNSNVKDNFPNTKKISEIALMVNNRILEDIKNKKIMLNEQEIGYMKEYYFESIIEEVKKTKAPYIGKTLLKENKQKFYNMVLTFMEKYNILEKSDNDIVIYPSVARMIGKTKNINEDEMNNEQISLFGGTDEL